MKDKLLAYISNKNYTPQTLLELAENFDCRTSKEKFQEFNTMIANLEAEQRIQKTLTNKYIISVQNKNVGKLSITKSGYGFIETAEKETYFVSVRDINNALNGDRVSFRIIKNQRFKNKAKKLAPGKVEFKNAYVLETIERDKNLFTAEFQQDDRGWYRFIPDDKKMNQEIVCKETHGLVNGHKVLLRIKFIDKSQIHASLEKLIGHKNDPGVDILSILYNNAVRTNFPEEVNEEVSNIDPTITLEERKKRVDLTKLPISTIDPWDAKDLDDAIYVKKEGDGYRLYVSIADVSFYVKEHQAIDNEAFWRGTSVYLTDRVIPMLPHRLSNDICSLNPNVERLTQTAEMTFDKSGKMLTKKVYASIINSHRRFAYDEVNDFFENRKHTLTPEQQDQMTIGRELHRKIRTRMEGRGYIDFDIPETKIVVDEKGFPIDIKLRERGTAQMMIEDFMIAANEAVAEIVTQMKLPFIYRIHESPKALKTKEFYNFSEIIGFPITNRKPTLTQDDVKTMLKRIEDLPSHGIFASVLLRCMEKAIYTETNHGHFGLGSKCYTHFTSPIRRYPDLIVHRLLRTYIYENNKSQKAINFYNSWIPQAATQANVAEKKAQNTEYDVIGMKSAEFMMNKVGQEFNGIIATVLNFGFFVQLENNIEGLVPIKNMTDDVYTLNDKTMAFIGKSTGKKYAIGQKVRVRCVNANKEKAEIDLEIIK